MLHTYVTHFKKTQRFFIRRACRLQSDEHKWRQTSDSTAKSDTKPELIFRKHQTLQAQRQRIVPESPALNKPVSAWQSYPAGQYAVGPLAGSGALKEEYYCKKTNDINGLKLCPHRTVVGTVALHYCPAARRSWVLSPAARDLPALSYPDGFLVCFFFFGLAGRRTSTCKRSG